VCRRDRQPQQRAGGDAESQVVQRDAFWTATGLLAATAVAAALMSRGTGDGTGTGKGSR
jgi:hypothetical protein